MTLFYKRLVFSGLFALSLLGAVGMGLAVKQHSSAATVRDCSTNSIDRKDLNGGCGAADPDEFIKDVKANDPSDLKDIYANFGLSSGGYDAFAKEAKQGTYFRDGHIEVDGQTVATDAWSMGRETFGNQRTQIKINNKTYYHSAAKDSFASNHNSLPVMVWFAADGTVRFAVMNPCGNPITRYDKVTPSATCKAISATQPDKVNKPNTYRFTTSATFAGNAVFSRVVYTFSDDGTSVTKTSLTDAVEHTFKKSGKVTATVYAKVPGGKEIKASVVNCEKQITYVAPMFVCVNLVAATLDEQKRSFRFTVKAKMDATTSLKGADFTLDGKATTTGVTTKDSDGNIYKDYTFDDENTHTVKAAVNFNTSEGVKSNSCEASVTPKKQPKCEVPGFENLPPNDERCGYCKPGVPKGDKRCEEHILSASTTMPDTGPGDAVGLFAGTSVAGFLGHKLYLRRKSNR